MYGLNNHFDTRATEADVKAFVSFKISGVTNPMSAMTTSAMSFTVSTRRFARSTGSVYTY